jgi:uncharacterized protein (DUF342 family)
VAELTRKYKLQKTDNGIYLVVQKDNSYRYMVTSENLYYELSKRKITYDAADVEKQFLAATGESKLISNTDRNLILSPLLNLSLSADKMSALLLVYPSLDGTAVKIQDIESILKDNGIIIGIRKDLFPAVTQVNSYYTNFVIAQGIPPIQGENAKFEFYFNTSGMEMKPKELENGSVDFHELELIQVVSSGTVLMEKIPATSGKEGSNVLGEKVPAISGKDIRLPAGANTQITDNNTKLIASKEGHVSYVNNKVNVFQTYEVRGDVDFTTGNIKFPGNVMITGNINNGFSVEAGGDVEINGNLEGNVKAQGNLQVRKGIVRGKAEVQGCIFARYIENGQADSKESIIVSETVMHSKVKASKEINVNGRKGLIVGGQVTAGEKITALNIGSPMGTATRLEVGVMPDLKEEYMSINNRLKMQIDCLDKNTKALNTLKKIEETIGTLPADKKELLLKVRRTQFDLQREIDELSQRKFELELSFEHMENASIKVQNIINTGVIINIGKATINLIEEARRIEYRLIDYEIKGIML